MTEDKFVMEENEKADEMAKDGAEVDGGATAAAHEAVNFMRQSNMRRIFMSKLRNGKSEMKSCQKKKKFGKSCERKEKAEHTGESSAMT